MSARDKLIRRLSEDSLGGIATLNDVTDAEQLVDAHRAEVLREAADAVDSGKQPFPDDVRSGASWAARMLRRMADEAVEEKATPTGEATPAELTIYRASHDSIVMGLYTTAAAAREHCETVVHREHADSKSKVRIWWREDEDTVDQPEDGEAELIEHVTPEGFASGYTRSTGYVVTALPVASKYDEEADE